MSTWIERVPLMGLLLSVLALAGALQAATGPDHLAMFVLALACTAAFSTAVCAPVPLGGRLVSVRRRAEVCRQTGVRSADPDRPGHVRPRAPGRDS